MEQKSNHAAPATFALTRRHFLGLLPVVTLPSSLFAAASPLQHVVICASGKQNPGLHLATWNSATGELGTIELAAKMKSPTFVALSRHAGKQQVYAVNEASGPNASVAAFEVENGDSALKPLDVVPSEGDGSTHLSVSPNGRVLAVANYGGGSISTFVISADGSIGERVSHFQFTGHGPNPDSQKSSHAHSVRFTPDGRYLLVNDLGLDRICVYHVDGQNGTLTPSDPPFWSGTPGSGPRHIAFHPNGRWVYSVNELDATIDILQWDGSHGRLTSHGRVSTAPEGSTPGAVLPGEIQISRDGKFVYAGNRVGSETIAVFSVHEDGAALKLEQLASNGGKNTRHLGLDPTGRWMLLSNIGSGEIIVVERDPATGKLSSPRHRYALDQPMCTAFL